jgi:hypothetical protein
MQIEKGYDISNKNIKILAYDLETKSNKRKKILKIVYKGIQNIYEVRDINKNLLLKGSPEHKIFDLTKNNFVMLKDSKIGIALDKNGNKIEYYCENSGIQDHIVDMQIEGENYFSNDILSHNTVFHLYLGEGLDDWQRLKDFIKRVMYNTQLPYLTITPTFSHCQIHGFIKGNAHGVCPQCKEEAIKGYREKLFELEEKKVTILKEIENDGQLSGS